MATSKRRIEGTEKYEIYEIIVGKEAKGDVLKIAKWYNRQMAGLGETFENHLDIAIEKLTTQPFVYSYLYKSVRKIKLTKFPYMVFYEVAGQNVNIYGVIHSKRKPAAYKNRLKKFL